MKCDFCFREDVDWDISLTIKDMLGFTWNVCSDCTREIGKLQKTLEKVSA